MSGPCQQPAFSTCINGCQDQFCRQLCEQQLCLPGMGRERFRQRVARQALSSGAKMGIGIGAGLLILILIYMCYRHSQL